MGAWDKLKAWWTEEDEAAPSQGTNPGAALPVAQEDTGILVGRDPATGGLLWYRGLGNVICVAPSRQGKLVSSIGGNVIFHPGSLLALDPKGEIAHHFHKLREGMGQPVYFLNPGKLHGLPCHGFNPLKWLDYESDSLMSDAAMIAQAIIPPVDGKDSHWADEAANLLRGLLLYAAFDSAVPDDRRDLITVRRLVQQGAETIKTTLLESDVPEAVLIGKMIDSKSPNELASVISTFTSNTNFLDDKGIQRVLGAHDFDLRELKSGRITVFLIVPLDMLGPWAKWYRLMVKLAIKAMMRQTIRTPDVQALFIIDETFAVGHLEDVETSFGLMPGQGLRLFLVVQSVQQLGELYPRTYRDLFNNAGLVQAFSVTDPKEAAFFQEMMAMRPRLGGGMGQFEPGERVDQIMYRRPGMLLARIQGQAPRWVERANWVNASIVLGDKRIPLPVAPEIEQHPHYRLANTNKV